jgi:hypothetical protein
MNRELKSLILAYEAFSASRDKEAQRNLEQFESLLERVIERRPGLSRQHLRVSIIKAHTKWAKAQDVKPPAIPPKA